MEEINEFIAWCAADPNGSAQKLGTFTSVIDRWLCGSHRPPPTMIEKWKAVTKSSPIESQKDPEPKEVEAPKAKAKAKVKKVEQEEPDLPSPGSEPEPPKADGQDLKLNGEWQGRNFMVLFPCYRLTNPVTAWSLVAMALDFGKEKIRFEMELGDAMVYHSRNRLADKFLKSGCEWSLWIDDDIIPPIGRTEWFRVMGRLPEDYPKEAMGYNVVNRLMSHKKTVVGATYYGRHPAGPPMHSDMHKPDAVRDCRSFKDGIRKVEWVATGCLLVHRQVYLDIMAKFPNLAPRDDNPNVKEFDFFLPEPGQGEDVAFCKRARAAGHDVYVDTRLQCMHVGFSAYQAFNTNQSR